MRTTSSGSDRPPVAAAWTAQADVAVAAWRPPAGTGTEVSFGEGHVRLTDGDALWVVTDGAVDMFVMEVAEGGPWHYVSRFTPGAVIAAPPSGPAGVPVLRAVLGSRVLRVDAADVAGLLRADVGSGDTGESSGRLAALARGIDAGLDGLLGFVAEKSACGEQVLLTAGSRGELAEGEPGRSAEGLVWVEVLAGRLRVGTPDSGEWLSRGDMFVVTESSTVHGGPSASFTTCSTGDLLADGRLWERLAEVNERLLRMADRVIAAEGERAESRIRAVREMEDTLTDKADRVLQAVLQPAEHVSRSGPVHSEDATEAACRIVADELGIPVLPARGSAAGGKMGPIEAIAVRSRFRIRAVDLDVRWWRTNIGPFVGRRCDSGKPVAFVWRRGRYVAWDPVTGERSPVRDRTAAEFDDTGVLFYPPLPERPVGTGRLILFGLKGSGRDIRNLIAFTLVAVAVSTTVPISTGLILGTLVPYAETNLIVQVSALTLVAALASAVFAVLENLALLRVGGRFEANLQAAVWDRLLRLPAPFFRRYSTGELASAALGVKNIRTVLTNVSYVVLYSSVVAVVNFAVMFWFSVPLALLTGLYVLVGVVFFVVLGARQMKWQTQSLDLEHKLANRVYQRLRGLPKLRVAGAENRAFAAWANEFAQQKELQKRIGRYQNAAATFNAVYPLICVLLTFAVISGPARGTLSMTRFLSFNAALGIVLAAVIQVTNSLSSAFAVIPMFKRMKPLLAELPEASEAHTVPGELTGEIEVNRVTFRYDENSPPVLDNVSLSMRPGEFVAVVGPSGCGKSTLLRLLLGFEHPTSGNVLYDGQDLATLDSTAVRRQCGVVLQQTKPFAGTVFQAITGTLNYSHDDAWAAAELAGIAADIRAMPMGMHTLVSDSGTFSGGQRQRLAIAHALIRRPRILFFDEATSALDNETQRIVTESTQRLNATRVVIAHRLSTVLDADKVVVLAEGRVAECGPPSELLRDSTSLFHQLVRRQMHESEGAMA
ncbi:NHLP bacteriocin export ABC transporter permease/ATPase subunit [Streptomyces sp. CB01881]|uniref:NHLP bacteriocin export ABC transporter permease/ATPase subunit n=1 Tax=Streptomyces sp. CB01881 TaxID=2078691 RepID=UPI0011DF24A8|nr:NHLP bacteriocin export ABC transporter permease/ATPase subunit [Streptomyces sp. CB01881]TYC70786.1 NHLP bacteriocin export ABC transporter permease/ATPase subunit [Streptomyces sp. CB01881]